MVYVLYRWVFLNEKWAILSAMPCDRLNYHPLPYDRLNWHTRLNQWEDRKFTWNIIISNINCVHRKYNYVLNFWCGVSTRHNTEDVVPLARRRASGSSEVCRLVVFDDKQVHNKIWKQNTTENKEPKSIIKRTRHNFHFQVIKKFKDIYLTPRSTPNYIESLALPVENYV